MQETREIRALTIAATTALRPTANGWKVPSQSGTGGTYLVDPDFGSCTCPDHETRAVECKHIMAVRFTIRREKGKGGVHKITKEVQVTYSQNWTAYNAAQCEEKDRFLELLGDLCRRVDVPRERRRGRPVTPASVMAFAAAYKVYSRFSSRRFTSDLRAAHEAGLIPMAPHFNSVCAFLSNPALTPILRHLITLSALPLKGVESDFAIDSSGFSTSRFVRWFNKKYGHETDNREWVKLHLMCGVVTNIVTSAEVTGWSAADTNFFRPLLAETAETSPWSRYRPTRRTCRTPTSMPSRRSAPPRSSRSRATPAYPPGMVAGNGCITCSPSSVRCSWRTTTSAPMSRRRSP